MLHIQSLSILDPFAVSLHGGWGALGLLNEIRSMGLLYEGCQPSLFLCGLCIRVSSIWQREPKHSRLPSYPITVFPSGYSGL